MKSFQGHEKGIGSRSLKAVKNLFKKSCVHIAGTTLGKRAFDYFGVPAGVEWAIEKKGGAFSTLYPTHTVRAHRPLSIDPTPFDSLPSAPLSVEVPADGILTVPGGLATYKGGNLSDQGKLISTFLQPIDGKTPEKNDLFHFSRKKFFPKIYYIDQPVITLATGWQWAFYHWVFEVLPRIHLAEKAGLSLKNIYVESALPFQEESLALLGIGAEQQIKAQIYAAVQSPLLIVPSIPVTPTSWSTCFLRERIIPQLNKPPGKRIYISRNDATRRRVINEKEVLSFLKNYGFQSATLSPLTFKEQAELFLSAEAIIGPHGAGFSHCVFCQPKTPILEIFSPSYVNPCYWHLSERVDLCYHYLFGESEPGMEPVCSDPHIYVDLGKLEASLQLMDVRLLT